MFDYMQYMVEHGHENLVFCHDRETGLRAVIGIHNTVLGPGLGGTRLWIYEKTEDAVLDVLRLSEGMTYKSACAGLALGGGKAVIMGDGKEKDATIRKARFAAFARFIDRLGGSYITAEDVGTSPADMVVISQYTKHVLGLPGGSGDPSPFTSLGVLQGIKAMADEVLGKKSLKGLRIAVQGLGHVGLPLVKLLSAEGAVITCTDISAQNCEAAKQYNVTLVKPEEIFTVDCDIFSPNALGAVLNDETIPRLKCKIVAGAANNQLKDPVKHSQMLLDRGIAYAVDYVLNAGGVINVSFEPGGYNKEKATEKVMQVYDNIKKTLHIAKERGITTYRAAQLMAEEAIQAGKNKKK